MDNIIIATIRLVVTRPSYCRRPSATLRQRLLGSTNSVSSKSSRSSRPEDRNQLTALWQQLKSDIETAMAKKPAGRRAESGQYKRFSVITKEVGRLS